MQHLAEYGLFLAKGLTLLVIILVGIAGILALLSKNKTSPTGELTVKKLNETLDEVADELREIILEKTELKKFKKEQKRTKKEQEKNAAQEVRKRVFVIRFEGDMKASQVAALREEVTAVLQIIAEGDEVVIKLDSPGGVVYGYGLAASQLARLRDRHISLTACVDKVAASGGYLMACVADKIIAAPFAIIGSIGVLAQMPNFHRLLKKNEIDFEQVTAGKYKRTLTMFGENTAAAREKTQQDLEEVHHLFKQHIVSYRPAVDIEHVATGEYWLATDALKLHLVDRLMTSDDYLLYASQHADVFEITYQMKKNLGQKLGLMVQQVMGRFL